MKKFDWDELVPVYGAFGIFSHWETRGVNYTKKILPIAMCLVVLKEVWDFLRFRHI
jgi:hypothetical protein